jgi:hypothetical protein
MRNKNLILFLLLLIFSLFLFGCGDEKKAGGWFNEAQLPMGDIDYSLVVTTIALLIALWQFWSRKKLNGFLRLEAMELYRTTGILLGAAQSCLGEIKNNNMALANADVGKIEGMAQALFQKSIKNIHHHFNYSEKTVDRWLKKNKIDGKHKKDFLTFIVK